MVKVSLIKHFWTANICRCLQNDIIWSDILWFSANIWKLLEVCKLGCMDPSLQAKIVCSYVFRLSTTLTTQIFDETTGKHILAPSGWNLPPRWKLCKKSLTPRSGVTWIGKILLLFGPIGHRNFKNCDAKIQNCDTIFGIVQNCDRIGRICRMGRILRNWITSPAWHNQSYNHRSGKACPVSYEN